MKSIKIKTRAERGITLVALIITIVILLILATVAITSIEKQGIIEYAENAKIKWNQEQIKEQTFLNEYLDTIEDVANPPQLISVAIDGVTYQAEAGMTWGEWAESKYDTNNEFYVLNDASTPWAVIMCNNGGTVRCDTTGSVVDGDDPLGTGCGHAEQCTFVVR